MRLQQLLEHIGTRLSARSLARRRRRLARGRGTGPKRASLMLLGSLAILGLCVVASFVYLRPSHPGTELSLDRLAAAATSAHVFEATLLDEDARIVGTIRDPATPAAKAGKFWTAYPRNDATTTRLIELLSQGGARVRVDAQTAKSSVRLLLTVLLPLMILANLFALFFTAGRGGGSALGEVVSFGTIGRRARSSHADVTFADVAGVEEAVVELAEVVDYLRHPEKYRELGAVPPKGVLLFGPPGCGKTLLARAVAGEAGVPFFAVAGAEFVESLVGVGAARVRDLFARVRSVAPAIVFIDELDAAGRRRGGSGAGGSDERDQTLNQLLVEMDGFDVSSGIVVMGATNRPDILDPALLRPGRFDRHVTIDRPDSERRRAILELHARGKPIVADVDFEQLARQTPGFSGADLANVVNEATLLAIRDTRRTISASDLSEAVQRVLNGPQRRGHLLSPDERRRLAAHEAGRAVLASLLGRAASVHRVSIVARGTGLAGALLTREDESAVETEDQLLDRLTALFGGRSAEMLLLGDASTAGEHDLEAATRLARDVAGRWGLGSLGPQRILEHDAEMFLSGAHALAGVAQATHERFDTEVARLLGLALERATRMLVTHRPAVERLVTRLLEEETLEGDELAALLPAPALGQVSTARARPARTARSGA